MEKINPLKVGVLVLLGLFFSLMMLSDTCAQKVPSRKPGKIYGKVAVITKSGDVKPVAKRLFYLLPFNLYERNLEIMEEVKKEVGPEPQGLELQVKYIKKTFAMRFQRLEEEIQKARRQGKYAEFKTDFDGRYEVQVPAGSWYISEAPDAVNGFGVTIGNSYIMWILPVKINPGQKVKIDLSNDNAYKIGNLR
jgi:hypothetical protein